MPSAPPFDVRLAGVFRLRSPIWVFDVERFHVPWANPSALELWRAASLDELNARDFSNMSPATRTRTDAYLRKFREEPGSCVEEEWTFYPKGVPTRVRCIQSGIETEDGRIAMFVEGQVVPPPDPRGVRGLEALRHVSAMVTLVDPQGTVLMTNPAAERAFGETSGPSSWFVDEGAVARILAVAETDEVRREGLLANTSAGLRWHAVEARRASDPATGGRAVVVHQVDLTERRAREALIEAQRLEILALSAPLIDVGEGVVAVPIVAELDEARSQRLEETVLSAVASRGSRVVVLDLTGGAGDEGASISRLLRLSHAIRLLGARPILTGIRAEMAQRLAASGHDLGGIEVMRSLRDALTTSRLRRRFQP